MTAMKDFKEKPKRKPRETVVFRAPLWWRIIGSGYTLFFLFCTVTLSLGIVRSVLDGMVIEGMCCSVGIYMLGGLTWCLVRALLLMRVDVSPEGIKYWVYGRHGFAFWHDMECIDYRPDKDGEEWGIMLNRSVHITIDNLQLPLFRGSELGYLETFIPVSHILFINVKGIMHPNAGLAVFRDSALGRAIDHYAPHVYENTKKKAS